MGFPKAPFGVGIVGNLRHRIMVFLCGNYFMCGSEKTVLPVFHFPRGITSHFPMIFPMELALKN